MTKTYVLDSYAILALLEDEPRAQAVADLIVADTLQLFLSIINLGEVFYIVWRRHGEAAARAVGRSLWQEDRLTIVEASWPRVEAAARLKAAGGLSYADAFGLGLAQELAACLVTGDPELRSAAARWRVDLLWLGAA